MEERAGEGDGIAFAGLSQATIARAAAWVVAGDEGMIPNES